MLNPGLELAHTFGLDSFTVVFGCGFALSSYWSNLPLDTNRQRFTFLQGDT